MTPGRADVLTLSEREVEAYSAEKEIIDKNLFNMPDWALDFQRARIETRLAQYQAKAKADHAAITRAKGLPLPEFDIKSHTEDELDAIRKGAAELRAKVETEKRRAKTAPPMAAQSPMDRPRAAEISDPMVLSDTLDLARRVCSGYAVPQAEVDSLLLRLGTYVRLNPVASGYDTICEGALYNELCGAALEERSLGVRALSARAQNFRNRNKPESAEAPAPPGTDATPPPPARTYGPDGPARGRDRGEGPKVPDRHWNPTFH